MPKLARIMAAVSASVALTSALAACAGPITVGPGKTKITGTPKIVHAAPPSWAPQMVAGGFAVPGATPPQDNDAMSRAKRWIVSATPPPGVKELDAAPAGAPARPATLPACSWLVRATRWWATDSSNVAAAQDWLRAHPVSGLRVDGTMSGPGELSGLSEVSAADADDSLQFEFAPDAALSGTVDIRVDVTVVPQGAGCASGR